MLWKDDAVPFGSSPFHPVSFSVGNPGDFFSPLRRSHPPLPPLFLLFRRSHLLSHSITLLLGNPKSKNPSLPPFALSAPDPILFVAPSLPKKSDFYEYLPRGSLEKILHGGKEQKDTFDWNARYKVELGVASALNYLHGHDNHRPVIHRDIKVKLWVKPE
ncbi:putative receptor-like serine/threonine-protein kinase [Carex littledalei]|uniref:Putative receptor-like serine/threonine-protein kinase n=1 Tax=Carex littledalei TaxID=544730 RepID=A0A833R5P6_9POAL|nr:putative receptor-like serine/threonine-protein kinase [Carex littledalei]